MRLLGTHLGEGAAAHEGETRECAAALPPRGHIRFQGVGWDKDKDKAVGWPVEGEVSSIELRL